MGLNFYFWRTYNNQEIYLIEENGQGIEAFEIKTGKKMPKVPRPFAESYHNAPFSYINRENYLDFIL